MCGIAGVITDWPSKGLSNILSSMLGKIYHRGPDQSGLEVFGGRVGLGMNRLTIVDGSKHEIPYFNEDRTLALVFNGEIFNFREIRRNLREKHVFKTEGDTETILHAFEEKGIDCIHDFNGMFAFAIYDFKTGRLYLGRDRIGKKSIYYSLYQGTFYFSSEIRAILDFVPSSVNWRCLPYRAFEFCCDDETMFKDVFALQPGEYLILQDGEVSLHNYWKIWDQYLELPDDEKKLENMLADLIEDSVLLRSANLGHSSCCLVSGGVDSSLLAAIARPQVLYTAHYPLGQAYDELPYAKLLSEFLRIPLKIVRPSPEEFVATRGKIINILEQPATWTSFTLYRLVEEASKEAKVIFAGEGPDEIFGGYARHMLLYNDLQIFNMDSMKEYHYLINKYYGPPELRYARLINRFPDADDELREYLEKLVGFYFSKAKDPVHGMGMVDFYTTMQVLLQMSDKISMSFSCENRHPFLDHRLVQFAFSMPSKFKIQQGVGKHIFKQVAKKFIPAEIADRKDKRGFSAPVNLWFKWTEDGSYDRSQYKNLIYNDWLTAFFGNGPQSANHLALRKVS